MTDIDLDAIRARTESGAFRHPAMAEDVPALIAAVQRRDDALAAVLALCEEAYADHDYPLVTASSIHRAITAHLAPADNPTTED